MSLIWRVDHLVKVKDGDSLIVSMTRLLDDDGHRELIEHVPEADLRLVTLDTPERGELRWGEARADLATWLGLRPILSAETYGRDSFGRYLADVYVTGHRDDTASQWMLREKGWLPWVRK